MSGDCGFQVYNNSVFENGDADAHKAVAVVEKRGDDCEPSKCNRASDVTRPPCAGHCCNASNFDILKVIGKGGYGKVLLVRKNCGVDEGHHFAMKVVKKSALVHSDKDVVHTNSEMAVLAKFKNKFIVDLVYAFRTERKLYFVMEYVQGGELFSRLDREGLFNEGESRFYAAELVLAVEFLHKNGILYRDLKPENILISRTGHIKLTDFGLCKELCGALRTHTFCGTIEYMAPEILSRTGHGLDADWWGLGAVLFDMLTGRQPFVGDDRNQTITLILRSSLVLPNFLSKHAANLLKALLVKKPELRLGHGATDAIPIKGHPFFAGVDWDELESGCVAPPFVPCLKSEADTSLFDFSFTRLPAVDSACAGNVCSWDDDPFENFSYTSPSVLDRMEAESWKARQVRGPCANHLPSIPRVDLACPGYSCRPGETFAEPNMRHEIACGAGCGSSFSGLCASSL